MRTLFPRLLPTIAALPLIMSCLWHANAAHAQLSGKSCSARKIVAMGRCHNCLVKEDRRAVLGGAADYQRCHDKLVSQFSKLDATGDCGLTGDAEVAYSRITSGQSDLAATFVDEHFAAPDPAACAADQLKAAGQLAKCRAIHRASEVKASNFWNDYADNFNYYDACMNAFAARFERIWADGTTCPSPGYDGWNQAVSSTLLTTGYIPRGDFRNGDIGRALLAFGALAGSDFSNATLHNTNLEDADLAGATFGGALFRDAPVRPVSMSRANLADADFSTAIFTHVTAGALVACPAALPADWVCINNHLLGPRVLANDYDLGGHDLEGLDLTGAWFNGSDFSAANLRGVEFGDGRFLGSDFSGADLTNAVIGYAEFAGVNFDGANFSGVDLSHFDYSGTRYSARNLAACPSALVDELSCTQGSLLGPFTIVDGLDFSGEDLSARSYHSASFVGATLVGTNLASTSLSYVNFTGANLTGANLAGARLDAVWSATICPDGMLSDDVGGTCCGHHVGSPPADCD
jgi:uncharacterized protein YjbI with pentapeptide repeats